MLNFLMILIGMFPMWSNQQDSIAYQLTVGSYTQKGNAGIEIFNVIPEKGQSIPLYQIKNSNASFIAFSSDKKYMYAVHEENNGPAALSAYQLSNQGRYELLNTESVIGGAACHVIVNSTSNTVYVANYVGGSLSVFKTNNGKLLPVSQHISYKGKSINASRQEKSHAHHITISSDFNFIYVTDLGTDKIHRHRIYADGTIDEKYVDQNITPGNGPRHLIFNSLGSKAYLINELKGVIDVFNVSDAGLIKIQTIVSDTTTSKTDRGSAEIQISPNGKWLISSNRVTNNDLAVFSILDDGKLKAVSHQTVGLRPRCFNFTPDGKYIYVACQDEDKIQVFSFNDEDGSMKNLFRDISVKMPVYLDFQRIENSSDVNERLKVLGIELKQPSLPIANYVKVSQTGNLLYISGHGPELANGVYITGKLGKDLSVAQGQEAARLVGLSILSTLKGYLGDLNRVKKIVKVLGLVNSDPEFTDQPLVINGFSNLMVEVFGEKGRHARSAVGTNSLPRGMAVEIELVVEIN